MSVYLMPNVSRIITAKGHDGVRYCILAVANCNLWLVVIGFDKNTMAEIVESFKPNITPKFYDDACDHLIQSPLPEVDPFNQNHIVIPFYSGKFLAVSIDRYFNANACRFKPFHSWPATNNIPYYDFIVNFPDRSVYPEETLSERVRNLMNGILTYKRGVDQFDFHLFHSKSQWESFAASGKHGLTLPELKSIEKDVESSVLPENSELLPVSLDGSLAWFFNKIIRYDVYMSHLVNNISVLPWNNLTSDGLLIN